jgi:hypothetical protein
MPGGIKGDVKYGFYLGIGAAIAFALLAFMQMLTLRAVAKRNG